MFLTQLGFYSSPRDIVFKVVFFLWLMENNVFINCGIAHCFLLFRFSSLQVFYRFIIPLSFNTARLCHVFHYQTNVLVTVSLICESTWGKKHIRGQDRASQYIEIQQKVAAPSKSLGSFIAVLINPCSVFHLLSLLPVDKILINIKWFCLFFSPTLNAQIRISLPIKVAGNFCCPPRGQKSWKDIFRVDE